MSDKVTTGELGENVAAAFLREKGFQIVARNFRFRKSEVDIIARRDDWLLFVEVKTRASEAFGAPESFVNYAKASQVFQAAEEYIFRNDWQGHVRFDVISVKLGPPIEVNHFEDAIN